MHHAMPSPSCLAGIAAIDSCNPDQGPLPDAKILSNPASDTLLDWHTSQVYLQSGENSTWVCVASFM